MMKRQLIEKKEIEFKGHIIEFTRKRIKNINLSIRTDGSIKLSVPFKLKEDKIFIFLDEKEDWIIKNKAKFKNIINKKEKEYITGEIIEYLDNKYILNIVEIKNNNKETIKIDGEYIDIFVLVKNNNKEYISKFINKWYKEKLNILVTDLTKKWAKIIGVSFNEIKIRKLKRTWGSCNIRKKNITYSLELIKKKEKLIEYVVVHELSHLKYDNHGKEFKNLMTKLMPDWKVRKKELNNMKGF